MIAEFLERIGCFEGHLLAGDWVVHGDHGRVEVQAWCAGVADVLAVEFIAEDGRVESGGFAFFGIPHCRDEWMGAVDTELMGASGVGLELDAGDGLAVELFPAQDGVVGDGGFAVEVIDEHERADIHVLSDRCVDGALIGVEVSLDEREVAFGDLAVLELLGEVLVRFGIHCQDHDP